VNKPDRGWKRRCRRHAPATDAALDFVGAHRSDAQVYAGGCEQLSTPEPLGPLRDIERDSRGRFSVSGNSQLATFEALLRLLTSARDPGLLLIEDLHWADDPTLDLFRYLGRRIRTARLLVIATFRSDEAPSHSRLAALWTDMPRRLTGEHGVTVLNSVALNQVIVTFGSGTLEERNELTRATVAQLQADNICLAGGAQWRGHFVRRLSLIAAPLVEADVDRLAAAILAAWRRVCSAARQRQLARS